MSTLAVDMLNMRGMAHGKHGQGTQCNWFIENIAFP